MFFDWFRRWSLKMKLHVIIAVLSFFLHQGIARADDVKEAKQYAMVLKENPTKEGFNDFVEKKLHPVVHVLKKRLSSEKDKKTTEDMIDSLKKLETAAGIDVETVIDKSFKINGIINMKSTLQNWTGKDLVFDVAGRSIRINKEEIQKIKDSNQNLGYQAYAVWREVEKSLKDDYHIIISM